MKLWNLWEIRGLIMLSLILQTILVVLGSKRKVSVPHSKLGILLNVIVWCAYIGADTVATVAISLMGGSGATCRDESSLCNQKLSALWAPFLLLHLGGPDSITAFSMEDNDLWLRHFLILIMEIAVTFHVFMRFWSTGVLTFLAIPVFITGIIKYGERTWVLWLSSKRFNRYEGSFYVRGDELALHRGDINSKDYNLIDAYYLYRALRCLFMNYPSTDRDKEYNYFMIRGKSTEDTFKVVSIEVGFLYDILYTKADLIYSPLGFIRRFFNIICSIATLILFPIVADLNSFFKVDIVVTYFLLVGAVILDVYALLALTLSDWTKLELINAKLHASNSLSRILMENTMKFTDFLRSYLISKKRWSESIGQFNLISAVQKEKNFTFLGLENLTFIGKMIGEYQFLTWKELDSSLVETICNYLKEIAYELHQAAIDNFDFRRLRNQYLRRRGEYTLRYYTFRSFLVYEDYEARVIMWHLVTDKYYTRTQKINDDCRNSKILSDYMMYLLLFRPSIFPKGIGQLRYEHTYNHITGSQPPIQNPYSVLDSAEEIATRLGECEKDGDRRWKVIIDVWLELITYAASYCEWREHTQYLRRGGELLTVISILMIHLRLSKLMS